MIREEDFEEVNFEELDFVQPHKTVGQLISVDVLDKIRNEITMLWTFKRQNVIEILDKYRSESEG